MPSNSILKWSDNVFDEISKFLVQFDPTGCYIAVGFPNAISPKFTNFALRHFFHQADDIQLEWAATFSSVRWKRRRMGKTMLDIRKRNNDGGSHQGKEKRGTGALVNRS
jgi:hypothetical protein